MSNGQTTASKDLVQLDEAVLDGLQKQELDAQPVLYSGAKVLTLDPVVGDMPTADVLIGGPTVVGVGPGLLTAADDDGMYVVPCAGLTIVPAVVDHLAVQGLRSARDQRVGTLAPGMPATFAVLPTELAADLNAAVETMSKHPEQVLAFVADGVARSWNGRSLHAAAPAGDELRDPSDSPYLGMWIDETGFLHQELTADGRYDETRGGRPNAFQGKFWIDGERIDYLDDLGFWAFGDFREGVLFHAGYVLRRR
ncbi:MAG: hypothetical protein AVDCRST_MAG57-2911 [uncultured Blastococcus sp.]|uniref:Uncharacterized protein n=1 Tax=uncultured Blastococcus sp. TaxID=217144 RepID=A0A6J4J3S9_9ACTN|nr:MAG: hypothetical protein AVDCRST_MAG57-2911 [uncultured Blastococcus sp.]